MKRDEMAVNVEGLYIVLFFYTHLFHPNIQSVVLYRGEGKNRREIAHFNLKGEGTKPSGKSRRKCHGMK
jgi:hypothetical protein